MLDPLSVTRPPEDQLTAEDGLSAFRMSLAEPSVDFSKDAAVLVTGAAAYVGLVLAGLSVAPLSPEEEIIWKYVFFRVGLPVMTIAWVFSWPWVWRLRGRVYASLSPGGRLATTLLFVALILWGAYVAYQRAPVEGQQAFRRNWLTFGASHTTAISISERVPDAIAAARPEPSVSTPIALIAPSEQSAEVEKLRAEFRAEQELRRALQQQLNELLASRKTQSEPVPAEAPNSLTPEAPRFRPVLPAAVANPCLSERNLAPENVRRLAASLDEAFRIRQDYVNYVGDEAATGQLNAISDRIRSEIDVDIGSACVADYNRVKPLDEQPDSLPSTFPPEKRSLIQMFDARLAHVQQLIEAVEKK